MGLIHRLGFRQLGIGEMPDSYFVNDREAHTLRTSLENAGGLYLRTWSA